MTVGLSTGSDEGAGWHRLPTVNRQEFEWNRVALEEDPHTKSLH
jgi:hypothetical protein